MDSEVDVLIVGQGVAGTCLAYALLERGRRVCVVDDGGRGGASRVAAGILNPVTGPRLVKSWRAEVLLPQARAFYRRKEREWGIACLTDHKIVRLCRSEAEVARWHKRKGEAAYAGFLGERVGAGTLCEGLSDGLGGFEILGVAALDTDVFLDAARADFSRRGLWCEGRVGLGEVEVLPAGVRWGGVRARLGVWCVGWRHGELPWSVPLPFKPAKGEILTLRTEGPLPSCIVNREKWLLPLGGGCARLGSTYEWERLDALPTAEARRELLRHFGRLLSGRGAPQVLEHRAGVRPCSHDTKPYMGRDAVWGHVAVFNGFGSKGALMAPGCAAEMAAYLDGAGTLHPEAEVARVWR